MILKSLFNKKIIKFINSLFLIILVRFLIRFFLRGVNLKSCGCGRSVLFVLGRFFRCWRGGGLGRRMLVVLLLMLPCGEISCGRCR